MTSTAEATRKTVKAARKKERKKERKKSSSIVYVSRICVGQIWVGGGAVGKLGLA